MRKLNVGSRQPTSRQLLMVATSGLPSTVISNVSPIARPSGTFISVPSEIGGEPE